MWRQFNCSEVLLHIDLENIIFVAKKITKQKTAIMETKKTIKTTTTKAKTTENGVVKKRISKIMKAAEKYKGSVEILDMEALFKPVY